MKYDSWQAACHPAPRPHPARPDRDWSCSMDGIAATIWASQTTLPLEPRDRLKLRRNMSADRHGELSTTSRRNRNLIWTPSRRNV
jgi:hypothetical protein